MCLLMVSGLMVLIVMKGLGVFWPHKLVQYELKDGTVVLGEIKKREPVPYREGHFRTKVKMGNRDVYGLDFKWINEEHIVSQKYPKTALTIERREWGNMYGYLSGLKEAGTVRPIGIKETETLIDENHRIFQRIRYLEKKEIGMINYHMEKYRLEMKRLEKLQKTDKVQKRMRVALQKLRDLEREYQKKEESLNELYALSRKKELVIHLADGAERTISVFQIVRICSPNDMGVFSKFGFYMEKFWEFVSDEPREANTEGGIFPAIFGTVMMVMIMSIAVVPLGVLTAVFLKEYSSDNIFARLVRISVNNLAGVPSIVFGVFGLGFFIYFIGGGIDKIFFSEALPTPTFGTGGILWASLTLALLTVPVVVVATEEGLSSVPSSIRDGSYALGATKFETIWKVVLPQATPGILTGTILAMARAAGEVAPLMITGVVKLAPSLPLDSHFPFVHLERKFMHLGFHIYDVGFQSPNVEAAVPMVYTTTLVLVMTVVVLNLAAIVIRNKLRRKYKTASV